MFVDELRKITEENLVINSEQFKEDRETAIKYIKDMCLNEARQGNYQYTFNHKQFFNNKYFDTREDLVFDPMASYIMDWFKTVEKIKVTPSVTKDETIIDSKSYFVIDKITFDWREQ